MIRKKAHTAGDLSVIIHKRRCNGCVICLRACPTKAIRIRNGKAVILPDLCVDCGECIRVCPQRAVAPRVSTLEDMARFKVRVLMPSRVLYTQFGEDVLPNDILLALNRMGFDYVFDLAIYWEWFHLAVSEWLRAHPEIRPALSPVCPVVTRMITKRFPELIPNIVPLYPPREIAAKYIRRLLRKKLGLADADIGLFHITPCAAKIASIDHPVAVKESFLDGTLGLHDVYGDILKNIKSLSEEDYETLMFQAGGSGIGGELFGVDLGEELPDARTLSVFGIPETLEVLEQISAGRLAGFRYIQCNTCPDGCLGGPLTVHNRYMARATLRRLVQMFGTLPRVRPRQLRKLIEEGFFVTNARIESSRIPLDNDPVQAMAKLKMMNELTARLPGRRCGACGAPDCRTLAEDVVMEKAKMSDCPFYVEDEDREKP